MNTVVFSEVKAACLAVSTLSTQLEEIIKNKLKEVLGKYYKDSERSYFVRGVNTKQYTLLLECVYNNHFRGRIVYNEHYEEMSLESFFTNANLTESTAMEHMIAKKASFKNIGTYYNMELIDLNIEDFFNKHNISDYILV